MNFTNLASALALGMRCCTAFPAQEKHCCTCAQGLDQQTASIGQQRPWGSTLGSKDQCGLIPLQVAKWCWLKATVDALGIHGTNVSCSDPLQCNRLRKMHWHNWLKCALNGASCKDLGARLADSEVPICVRTFAVGAAFSWEDTHTWWCRCSLAQKASDRETLRAWDLLAAMALPRSCLYQQL